MHEWITGEYPFPLMSPSIRHRPASIEWAGTDALDFRGPYTCRNFAVLFLFYFPKALLPPSPTQRLHSLDTLKILFPNFSSLFHLPQ